jgi:hypothetical protein
VVEISLVSIKRTKDQVASETNQKCSTFDVVTAIMFKWRASTIDFAPDAEVHFQRRRLTSIGWLSVKCRNSGRIVIPTRFFARTHFLFPGASMFVTFFLLLQV